MFASKPTAWLKRTVRVLLVCFFVSTGALMFAEPALAQGGDKNLASQQGGMEGLLSRKSDPNDPRRAKPWQRWLGFGSFGVMIIVVKYL